MFASRKWDLDCMELQRNTNHSENGCASSNCSDPNCNEAIYNAGDCAQLGSDAFGNGVDIEVHCNATATLPNYQAGGARWDISNDKIGSPDYTRMGQATTNSVCTAYGGGSNRYRLSTCGHLPCFYSDIYAPDKTCSGTPILSIHYNHLEAGYGGTSYIPFWTLMRLDDPSSIPPVSVGNVYADYYYDSTCTHPSAKGGRYWATTDASVNAGILSTSGLTRYTSVGCDTQGTPYYVSCPTATVTQDCAYVKMNVSECVAFGTDESARPVYYTNPICSTYDLTLGGGSKFQNNQGCTGVQSVGRENTQSCVVVQGYNGIGQNISRIYNCTNNVSGYTEYPNLQCSGVGTHYTSFTSTGVCNNNTNLVTCHTSIPSCFTKPSTDPTACSGNGTCVALNTCQCLPGYTGSQCQTPPVLCFGILQSAPNACSGNGNCTSNDVCQCKPGFMGNLCQTQILCYGFGQMDPRVCSGNGTCISSNNCTCNTGFFGNNCQNATVYCYGLAQSDPLVCSGKGPCVSKDVCNCTNGFYGNKCQNVSCFGYSQADPNVCSRNGTCRTGDTCKCNPPYFGIQCERYPITPPTTCSGIVSYDPNVCSRNGTCIAQDTCQCVSPYWGPQCEFTTDIPPNSQFNLTTNLTSTGVTVSANSTLVISTPTLTLTNSNLTVEGTVTITSTILTLVGTTISIRAGGNLIISANAFITGDPTSTLETAGKVSILVGTRTTRVLVPIINRGSITISGAGNINLANAITQSETAVFTSLDSNITVSGDFVLKSGFVNLSGKLTANNINITDSFFKSPNGLQVQGSLNLNSTTVFEISSPQSLKQLLVSGVFSLYSTVILKLLPGFAPAIGDQLNVIPSASDFKIGGNFIIIGGSSNTALKFDVSSPAPIQGYADITQVQTKTLKLTVTNSIGDSKSICTYLGNGKNLEYYFMDKYVSVSFVIAAPRNTINYGIGWNDKNVFNQSNFVLFTNDSTVQTIGSFLVDSVVKTVPQLFGVGPPYLYINILVTRGALVNQTHLFYVESTQDLHTNLSSAYTEVYSHAIGVTTTQDCTNFVTPYRAETYSIAGMTILLAFYAGLFLLCCLFTLLNAQPLHTRGVSPFYILGFLFIQQLTEIRNYYYPTNVQSSLCLFYAYLYYPALQSCFIVILFYYIRYFLIINMNEVKNTIDENDGDGGKSSLDRAKTRIKLIKIFLSKWTIIGYLIGTYLLVNLLFTIVLASNRYVCSYSLLVALKVLNSCELIIVYVMILSAILFDIVMNWRKVIRCPNGVINYLFYSDPFWFRSQIIMFLIYLVYQLAVDIAVLSLSTTYIATMEHYYPIAVLNTVSCIFLVLIDVIYPLAITVIYYYLKFVRCRCEKKDGSSIYTLNMSIRKKGETSENKIQELMADENGFALLLAFCKSEWSVENIHAYIDLHNYKMGPTLERAQEIFNTYLKGRESHMELNVPRTYCTKVKEAMEKNEILKTLFQDIEQCTVANLCDTYFRLTETAPYKKYSLNQKAQKELLEVDKLPQLTNSPRMKMEKVKDDTK